MAFARAISLPERSGTTKAADGRALSKTFEEVTRGQPLASSLRHDLEAAFGADFSAVRIHADRAAGESALAVGARAYTIGTDIVFAPGRFAPETDAGRELLLHELAHVREDGGRARGVGPLRIEPPGSAQEDRAEAAARAGAAGPGLYGRLPNPAAPHSSSGPILYRSLLGAGLGGTIGAVGLGLLGGLLGPAAGIVGAVIGGVGGLLIGDVATRRSRSLSGPEKEYLREIFRDSVDYEKVTITRGSALSVGSATTTANTINLEDKHFSGDTMDLNNEGVLTLAHEMGHVWQYQNGGLAYIPSSLIPQLVAALSGRSRNAAYDWRSAVRSKIDWSEWNAEQQAECISDYNAALRLINAGTASLRDYETVVLAEPFIALVRERIGAPGSKRRRPGPAVAQAGAKP